MRFYAPIHILRCEHFAIVVVLSKMLFRGKADGISLFFRRLFLLLLSSSSSGSL